MGSRARPLGDLIALLDPHLPVIRWIESGLAGTRFAEFDLQARVFDYACLFDDVEDTPRVAEYGCRHVPDFLIKRVTSCCIKANTRTHTHIQESS